MVGDEKRWSLKVQHGRTGVEIIAKITRIITKLIAEVSMLVSLLFVLNMNLTGGQLLHIAPFDLSL